MISNNTLKINASISYGHSAHKPSGGKTGLPLLVYAYKRPVDYNFCFSHRNVGPNFHDQYFVQYVR